MLHRDSAVKEVVPDQKEDIDRYVQWGEVDERPQVATEMRTKHLALQLDNKQRLAGPCAVAIDATGYYVVADTDNHRVMSCDGRGKFYSELGNMPCP